MRYHLLSADEQDNKPFGGGGRWDRGQKGGRRQLQPQPHKQIGPRDEEVRGVQCGAMQCYFDSSS